MSLATLAHSATPAAQPFNNTFYATVATIIPVLFLAIAVQGRAYDRILGNWHDITGLVSQIARFLVIRAPGAVLVISALIAAGSGLLLLVGFAIIAAGGYGELLAVYALYQGHDQPTTRQVVLLATIS